MSRINLRPERLEDYIGQEPIKEVLRVAIESAKKQNRPLDHILLNGPPGLGKTTLARIIAREMKWPIKTTIGSSIKSANDVKSIALTILSSKKTMMFIDEIHRVGKPAQEVLYPILEDGIWYYKVGPSVTEADLGALTVVGATTNVGRLEQPFVDRFGLSFQMEYYNEDEITRIVMTSMDKLGITMSIDAMAEVAMRCRFTPRIANNILKRLRDYNVARGIKLTQRSVSDILWKKFHLDDMGLNSLDRRVLSTLDKAVGPLGIASIAVAVQEEAETIESRVEPYLVQVGFIQRVMRGRMITDAGRNHISSY